MKCRSAQRFARLLLRFRRLQASISSTRQRLSRRIKVQSTAPETPEIDLASERAFLHDAMASPTETENALLRETVGRLEATVADKCAEIEMLKSKLALLESNDVRGAVRCGGIGSPGETSDEVAQGDKDMPDAPLLPNEIFLVIAAHLEPGTRSLSNLARSSRSLYEILISRLYKCFSVRKICDKITKVTQAHNSASSLPYGLASVQEIDARDLDDEQPKRARLVAACTNLVKLECDLSVFHSMCHEAAEFPRLEMLDLYVDWELHGLAVSNLQSWMRRAPENRVYHGMPNLRILKLGGQLCVALTQLLVDSCPLLSDAYFSTFFTSHGDSFLALPETFVAKIRDFEFAEVPAFVEEPTLASIVERFPSFAPERIAYSDEADGYPRDPSNWKVLCRLPFLKKVELGTRLDSSSVAEWGFPPNLQSLSVGNFKPTLSWFQPADFNPALKKLSDFVGAAQQTARFELAFEPDMVDILEQSNRQFSQFATEMRFWNTVRGFSITADAKEVDRLEKCLASGRQSDAYVAMAL